MLCKWESIILVLPTVTPRQVDFKMLFCRSLIGRQLWSSKQQCMCKERLRQRMKKEGGSWPSHLCSVSCHYVQWGSAKAPVPRFHSSSSYTRVLKTHTSPRAQRGGAASRVWQDRSPSFQTEQSSASVRGAQSLLQMLTRPPYCLLQHTGFQRRLGRKAQHDPLVSWRRRRGETLPVVTVTKWKKGTQRKKRIWAVLHMLLRAQDAKISSWSNYFTRIEVLFAKHCFNSVKSNLAPSQC